MVVIKSLSTEVLNKLSYEEKTFLEESISSFSDEGKLQVEEILSKISDEEKVARISKAIAGINETNRIIKERNLKWKAGLSPISFLSEEEKIGLCGLAPSPLTEEQKEEFFRKLVKISRITELPSSLDWRNNNGNWMTSVKSQGACGSCWAFATLGAIEAKIKIMQNNPNLNIDLSEQDLINCCGQWCSYTYNKYLEGGWMDKAYNYMVTTGVCDENCFPYTCPTMMDCSNHCIDWKNRLTKIRDYEPYSFTNLKEALVLYGPVTFGMKIPKDFRDEYVNGIYEPNPISETNPIVGYHAMIVVGYNDNKKYWIIKNSWRDDWGENGYCRMSYNAGDKLFLFDDPSAQPIFESTPITEPPTPPGKEVTINYTIDAVNTGIQQDMICGCSILNPNTGEELYALPWWIIWNVPNGKSWRINYQYQINIPAGTYLAKARAWLNYSGGTKIDNIIDEETGSVIGAVYSGGILTNWIDEITQSFTIEETAVSSQIINVIASFNVG